MPTKFLDSVGGKLAEKWVATLLTPAFIFWAGGTVVVLQHIGWQTISAWFTQQPDPLQIAILVAAFALIAASGFVAQRFDLSVLRFLEGYWYPWLRPIRRWLIAQEAHRSRRISDRWQQLNTLNTKAQQFTAIDLTQLTPQQRDDAIDLFCLQQNRPRTGKQPLKKLPPPKLAKRVLIAIAELKDELATLDWRQHHLPLPDQLMPTRLGNILRAAEQRPLEKYGLDAIICWSRLWLLLPDAVKQELQTARADLNTAARVWLWSMLFMGWGVWAVGSIALGLTSGLWPIPLGLILGLWPIPVGLTSAFFAYRWAIAAATLYGDLIDATFDLYRRLLYDSLRWSLPPDPDEERRVGRELTEYLWRGF